jgi:hypothetical protein
MSSPDERLLNCGGAMQKKCFRAGSATFLEVWPKQLIQASQRFAAERFGRSGPARSLCQTRSKPPVHLPAMQLIGFDARWGAKFVSGRSLVMATSFF